LRPINRLDARALRLAERPDDVRGFAYRTRDELTNCRLCVHVLERRAAVLNKAFLVKHGVTPDASEPF
jgi:hypothetical protein